MTSLFKKLKLFASYYLFSNSLKKPITNKSFRSNRVNIDLDSYNKSLIGKKKIASVRFLSKDYFIFQVDRFNKNSSKRLLIFAGVHGNESAGVLAVPKLLEEIKNNPTFYANWDIRIITPLNPVGVDYLSRYDSRGYDLNRDFRNFKTLGARIQRDAIDIFKPDVVISFHEGPQQGFFAILTKNISRVVANSITHNILDNDLQLAKNYHYGLKLINDGIMRQGSFFFLIAKVFYVRSLGFYLQKKGIPIITTESSWEDKNIEKRIKSHIVVVNSVIDNFTL